MVQSAPMILSFNPVITGEENLTCAGRPPGPEELAAASRASAIILPQGLREDLYRLCRSLCPLVWPNYDVRFDYPGKIGQALLFAAYHRSRPRTAVFPSVSDFLRRRSGALPRPFVLKASSAGQGSGVYPVWAAAQQAEALKQLEQLEKLGRGGFVQQEMIDHGGRDLRVVLLGRKAISYWRWAPPGESFLTNVAAGGVIDFESDPELRRQGEEAVLEFARETRIDLAGFDLLFDHGSSHQEPLFLEINFYFGRQALGGSEKYYRLLNRAAGDWLKEHGLKKGKVRSRRRYSQSD